MKHKFNKPYKFAGVEYKEIEFNIEDLTTLDYELAERQFKLLNPIFNGVIETEGAFCKQLIANAANIPLTFFDKLPVHEYIKLKYAVQSFLLGSASMRSEKDA